MFISREEIKLSEAQQKMLVSGWGKEAVENAIVEKISYLSDGLKVKGFLAYPKDISKSYPCVIWCRGGYGNAGATDEFNAQGIFGQLASWGYVVFAPQYRGNDGGEGLDEFGDSDVNDILNLIPLSEELPFAQNNNWAIEGWSRGGMMTYLTLTKTNLFKAAIVVAGIADVKRNSEKSIFMKKFYSQKMNDLKVKNIEKFLAERTILNFPEQLSKSTPLLLLHGAKDNRVLPQDSLDISYKLLDLQIPFRLVIFEKGDHFLKKERAEVNRLRKFWLDKHLKHSKSDKSMTSNEQLDADWIEHG